jgi:hypothetical protein
MIPTRKIAVGTGVLFIIATVAALLAAALDPDLGGADLVARISGRGHQVAIGAVLYLIAAFASVGITVSMYPVMKAESASLALGAVVFRTIEAVFYMAAVVSRLSVLTLGQRFASAGAAEPVSFQTVSDSLMSVRDHATLLGVFAFCVGAFMYYWLFLRARLVPRWLSVWGIVGILLMMAACMSSLFSDRPVTGYVALVLPIAVQEMVLAVWLVARGFSLDCCGQADDGRAA